MGYSTDFSGVLKFKDGTMETDKEHNLLEEILGADARERRDWKKFGSGILTHIDLCLSRDRSGIMWDGSEKTYDLPQKVSLLIRIMRSEFPNFGLFGTMNAKGERNDDEWSFSVEDDKVTIEESIAKNERYF